MRLKFLSVHICHRYLFLLPGTRRWPRINCFLHFRRPRLGWARPGGPRPRTVSSTSDGRWQVRSFGSHRGCSFWFFSFAFQCRFLVDAFLKKEQVRFVSVKAERINWQWNAGLDPPLVWPPSGLTLASCGVPPGEGSTTTTTRAWLHKAIPTLGQKTGRLNNTFTLSTMENFKHAESAQTASENTPPPHLSLLYQALSPFRLLASRGLQRRQKHFYLLTQRNSAFLV